MNQLGIHSRGAIRQFALWIANGSVGHPLLEDVDYSVIFKEPSSMEAAFAIFTNCLKLDDDGDVLNFKEAERRAAEYIRSYCDSDWEPEEPFADWEVELHPVSTKAWNR